MKVVTFNVRIDEPSDGIFQFTHRKPLIQKVIKQRSPDIIGFQEIQPDMSLWLKNTLTDYYIVGIGADADFGGGENCIAYKKDKFNIIKMENFWLSDTPQTPGTRFDIQSDVCYRSCTMLYMVEIATKKSFRIYNTHFDHEQPYAREHAAKLMLQKLHADQYLGFHPAILIGDFNAEADWPEMAPFKNQTQFIDTTTTLGATFHDFKRAKPEDQEKIDYIFVDKSIEYKNPQLWQEEENGIPLSDHYPVSVELILP